MSEWTRPAQPVRCVVELDKPLTVRRERGVLAQGDANANAIVAEVYSTAGKPYDLSGCTMQLIFVKPDNNALPAINAEISGNTATATLPDGAYAMGGMYSLRMQLRKNGAERTIVWIIGEVKGTDVDGIADPEHVISIGDIMESAKEAQTAASAANTAATRANAGADRVEQMQIDASGLAGDSNKLGGEPAEAYLKKDATAKNAESLGGKAPEYYLQPRNLLDNSDFRKPVNQRTANGTFEAWGGYTIDRWAAYANGATIGVTDDGLYLQNAIYQPISAEDMSCFHGKWLTFAVKMNGVVYVACGLFEQTDIWHMLSRIETPYGYISIEAQNDNKLFCVIDSSTTTTAVEWAALYEGIYTAETLPPYVPKGYAVELAECRRYYRVYKSVYIKPIILEGKNKRHYRFEFDSPMQSAPDPVFLTLVEKSMWSEVTRAFTAYYSDEYGITFASETMLSDSDDGTNVYCNGNIAFDCDL